MKSSDPKKTIGNLENQKVDSDKIQGGGARPEPIKLTKDQVAGLDNNERGSVAAQGFTSTIDSDGSILAKRGIRQPKGDN